MHGAGMALEAIAEHFVNEDRCEGFYPADCRNDKAEAGIEKERDQMCIRDRYSLNRRK